MKLFDKINPANCFLVLGLFYGILYFFITPPLQAPDEFNHFCRAYQVSEGTFISQKKDHRLGGDLPKSFQSFFVTYRFATTHPEYRFSGYLNDETAIVPLENDSTVFTDFANTAYYSPVSYAPQALVMFLLRQFNVAPRVMYLVGKFLVMLFWLLGIYFAIKMMPIFKWLFCLLALFPMNLLVANSFSADNVTNVLAFIWIATVFKKAYGQNLFTNRDTFLLLLMAAALALAKLVYVGLFILLFLIPLKNFVSRKKQLIQFVIIVVPACLLAYWWSGIAAHLYISYADYAPEFVQHATLAKGSNYNEQLHYIFSHNTYFLKVIFNSIFNPDQVYIKSYIGVFGAFMAYMLPKWIYVTAYIGIILVCLSENPPNDFGFKQRLVLFLSGFVTLALLLFSLQLIWDPVGSGVVWLLQGRYLVPIVPLFLMAIGAWIKKGDRFRKPLVIFTILVINSVAAVSIYYQYFYEAHSFVYKGFSGLEDLDTAGNFKSDEPHITFANQGNRTDITSRHGKYSVMLYPGAQYALTCQLGPWAKEDVIEVEFWKKGKGGVAVISGSSKNCEGIYAPNANHDFTDKNAWKKVHSLLHMTSVCDSSKAAFFIFQTGNDTVFVDDITLVHKTFLKKRD